MRYRVLGYYPRVCVVIPTYNEVENIGRLLGELREALESRSFNDFEVIVVDDDSPDGTWKVVLEESARDSRVKLVRRVGVRGLGS
ncbi:MAG: glycosyltransferase, partial [Acidilobaceae archaeon]